MRIYAEEGSVQVLQIRARFIVLMTIPMVVLLIVPVLNDSFNIPKYSVLFFAAAFGASVLSIPYFGLLEKKNWKTWAPPVLFLSILFAMALITDLKYTAFFGSYGRNNGWFLYLGLTVLFLLTAFSFNFATLTKLYHLLAVLGVIVAFYGFLQYQEKDFLDYNDMGFPVIATLGNSNFASSFMGLAGIALLWKITDTKSIVLKVTLVMLLFGQTYVIYLSQSSQGLFISIMGAIAFIGIRYFTSTRRIGITYFSIFGSALFLGLLGLFQIGPLSKFVYQTSTTYRSDYYQAAWRMFKENIFTGVGIDRYGENYRIFRDIDAALRLGPNFVADNAHNAFLQLLATGGVFLFVAYLVMTVFVAVAAIRGLRKFKDNDKAQFGALVALWIAFQVQAQVSIDQITIAVIGWIVAGAVVALGFNCELIEEKARRLNPIAKKRRGILPISKQVAGGLTLVLLITSLVWLVPIWRADYNIRVARILQGDSGDYNFLAEKKRVALSAVSSAPGEIQYKIYAADALVAALEFELARQQLRDALDMDSKSYEAISNAAQVYERANLIDEAIKIRIVATKMDPNDTNNWLQLGKNLVFVGDIKGLNRAIELVAPLAPKSTIANDLKALLPPVAMP